MREHARISIELLNSVDMQLLAYRSKIGVSTIYAAKRNDGHVRRKTKKALLKAIREIKDAIKGCDKCKIYDANWPAQSMFCERNCEMPKIRKELGI